MGEKNIGFGFGTYCANIVAVRTVNIPNVKSLSVFLIHISPRFSNYFLSALAAVKAITTFSATTNVSSPIKLTHICREVFVDSTTVLTRDAFGYSAILPDDLHHLTPPWQP
jgi:hypothetical protein